MAKWVTSLHYFPSLLLFLWQISVIGAFLDVGMAWEQPLLHAKNRAFLRYRAYVSHCAINKHAHTCGECCTAHSVQDKERVYLSLDLFGIAQWQILHDVDTKNIDLDALGYLCVERNAFGSLPSDQNRAKKSDPMNVLDLVRKVKTKKSNFSL